MTNSKTATFPQAGNDFVKMNGADRFTHNTEASRTRQEFAEECDINALMKRYEGHDIGSIMRRDMEPQYADFTKVPKDLMGFLNLMNEASDAFMTLPASVRREFDNDAVRFTEFAADPANLEKMREWKLAKPAPVEPVPQKVEVVNAPPKAP